MQRYSDAQHLEQIQALLEKLEIPFQKLSAYKQAFHHRSALNELSLEVSNERLEFLGDAILDLVITDYLFHHFPDASEWRLTDIRSALVRGRNLAIVASRLELYEAILMSHGERISGGDKNPYILANTFESLLGSMYLDLGLEAVSAFIHRTVITTTLDEILKEELYVDPKSHLQEMTQAEWGITPHYEVLQESGADHDKMYTVGVYIASRLIASGEGSSKKKAQTHAAHVAIQTKENWWNDQGK